MSMVRFLRSAHISLSARTYSFVIKEMASQPSEIPNGSQITRVGPLYELGERFGAVFR